jgi:hypothetical protein
VRLPCSPGALLLLRFEEVCVRLRRFVCRKFPFFPDVEARSDIAAEGTIGFKEGSTGTADPAKLSILAVRPALQLRIPPTVKVLGEGFEVPLPVLRLNTVDPAVPKLEMRPGDP